MRLDVVRGRIDEGLGDELVRFWTGHGALAEETARKRVPEVVCILRDDGRVVGANSVFEDRVDLIGGGLFWIYRRFLAPGTPAEAESEMLNGAFDALDAELTERGGGPMGLLLRLDPTEVARRPLEAIWADTGFVYAGYLPDRRQVRIRYFAHATHSSPLDHWALHPDYRIAPLAESEVTAEDVLDLWERDGVIPQEEALRRVHEVLLVATHTSGELVGVFTVYVQRNAQLRMDTWYSRGYVAPAHRRSNVSVQFGMRGYDLLEERYVSGRDRRAAAACVELENDGLRERFPEAVFTSVRAVLIGRNRRGHPVYVRFFAGAVAPDPPS